MRAKIIFIFIMLYAVHNYAQQVEWASEVVKFSTEASRKQYSSKQVLGPPNKLPAWGDSPCAWAASQPDNVAGEFIQVKFSSPMKIKQVAVGESYGAGSIKEIILVSDAGKKYSVYKNDTIQTRFGAVGKMFHCFIPLTDYSVEEVKIVLNTKAITGSNQIDCIGISDSDIPVEAKINEITYSEKIPEAENLGQLVNSRADDMLPIISPDGKTLYFGRKKHPDNIGEEKRDDIWVSTTDASGNWTAALNVGPPLNNENHNYLAWISPDGNTALLANNYQKIKQDISISKKTATTWSTPKALKINNFYNLNEFSCYHMNTEGNVIVMAIEREDSYGDMDIYISFLQKNGVWTEPKNLGNTINSAATEGSIFIAADNKTIYFASNGFSGYGNYDMFMSRRLDDTWLNWSVPQNLGIKINSKRADFYYTIPASGDYAYFSSTDNSFGGADLFRIKLPKELQPDPVTLLKGKLIDADSKKPIEADIQFGSLLDLDHQGTISTTKNEGDYQIIVPENDYGVTIKKEGYFPVTKTLDDNIEFDNLDYNEIDPIETIKHDITVNVQADIKKETQLNKQELDKKIRELLQEELKENTTTEAQTDTLVADIKKDILHDANNDSVYKEVEENIEMIPIREGQIIRLDNIFFEANKALLKDASKTQLNDMAQFLMANPGIYAEVGGHTNSLPSDDFCKKLSDARAKTVAEYLVAAGVAADHITWKGYGKTTPIADNSTLQGRKQNQRVELKILKVN